MQVLKFLAVALDPLGGGPARQLGHDLDAIASIKLNYISSLGCVKPARLCDRRDRLSAVHRQEYKITKSIGLTKI